MSGDNSSNLGNGSGWRGSGEGTRPYRWRPGRGYRGGPFIGWKLYQGDLYPIGGKGIFRVFLDSAPDRWGRVLLERREIVRAKDDDRPARSLTEWDFLLGVHDQCRMGALRFWRDESSPYLDDDQYD